MEVLIRGIVSEREFGIIAVTERQCTTANHSKLRVNFVFARTLGQPAVGEIWRIEGRTRNTQWGLQLEASRAVRVMPSGRLIQDFLASNANGVGPERAKALWRAFGPRLSEVLEGEDAVQQVAPVIAPDRPNLGPKLAAACVRAWQDAVGEVRTLEWLSAAGFEDLRTSRRVHRILGLCARDVLSANPYVLVPLLSWRKLDTLGLRLLCEAGVTTPRRDPRRLIGAVDGAMKSIIREGATRVSAERLADVAARLLGVSRSSPLVATALQLAIAAGAALPHADGYRAPGCAFMEESITARLRAMSHPHYPSLVELDVQRLKERLDAFTIEGRPLHDEQIAAVCDVLSRGFSCLQGGAGVGKTATTRAVCDLWELDGGRLILTALAGKAVLRLSRTTKRPAFTFARLLAQLRERELLRTELNDRDLPAVEKERCQRRLSDLVEINETTLVIVDEASMLDLPTLYALLRYMPTGARLLLVGDEAQLPPIGFGLTFHRIVSDPSVTARLAVVHRQTEASGIPAVAASIRERRVPSLPRFVGPASGVSLVEADEGNVAQSVMDVWRTLAGAGSEPMIVSATNERTAGILALNDQLSAERRGRTGAAGVRGPVGQIFSVGDPVVWLKNDYRRGLFNGLLGRISEVDLARGGCVVAFEGYNEPHRITRDELIDLSLGYAITCHRAQGSQAPAVIIPLYASRVLDASWLYTAITRAEQQAVLVGSSDALAEALRQPTAADQRCVGFCWPPVGPSGDHAATPQADAV